eukprot:6892-Heterococcus_DN1.PRE.4
MLTIAVCAVLLCQAAQYNVVIVETVGLGQSEVEVEQTVDVLLLLLPPAGGDDLQGSKKGIVEVADIIVVNKADGNLEELASRTASDYRHALKFNHRKLPYWEPPVLQVSSRTGKGVMAVWEAVEQFTTELNSRGQLDARRRSQGRLQQSAYAACSGVIPCITP